jgi:hypothetical protein
MKRLLFVWIMLSLLLMVSDVMAQDLDPRAYVRAPVNATFLSVGYGYSKGGVVTDATLPVKDIDATLHTVSLGIAHSFSLLGQTAQVSGTLPYSAAEVTGSVGGTDKGITRAGIGDMRMRISILFHGAPAATVAELAKAPRRTILGASLSILTPTGQYFSDKLINLGTHRWSFKPELALSQPIRNRWLLDAYAAVWLFTDNTAYYHGSSVRKQDPMGSFQMHVSYTIRPGFWGAVNFTYYTGGQSTIDGVAKDDLQSNTRIGSTIVLPVDKKQRHSVRLAASTGAVVTRGANFTTVSVGWQTFFLGKANKSEQKKR